MAPMTTLSMTLRRWRGLDAQSLQLQVVQAALLVGIAAALGAAISMGLSEGLSDDGTMTGRGSASARGAITGLATFVGGSVHALPFLISDIHTALAIAYPVVGAELLLIAWIRKRFQQVSLSRSLIQVTLG